MGLPEPVLFIVAFARRAQASLVAENHIRKVKARATHPAEAHPAKSTPPSDPFPKPTPPWHSVSKPTLPSHPLAEPTPSTGQDQQQERVGGAPGRGRCLAEGRQPCLAE
ncbi:hypothetical protein DFQ26_000784 [Actinomortierella ambigua]|nr:hypothetical protein DFQ26_000784 [Actinomortierella ambigua]